MRQSTKSAMGRGMAIAAHNGHSGQSPALLGANNMHDTLADIRNRIIVNAKISCVFIQRFHLNAAFGIVDAFGTIQRGGHIMIWHSNGFFRRAHFAPVHSKAFKSLRAGHLMHKMTVNIQQTSAILGLMRHMRIPDFIVKCFRGGHF